MTALQGRRAEAEAAVQGTVVENLQTAPTWPDWTVSFQGATTFRTTHPSTGQVHVYCARFRRPGVRPRYRGDRDAFRFVWLAKVHDPEREARRQFSTGQYGREIARGRTSVECLQAVDALLRQAES